MDRRVLPYLGLPLLIVTVWCVYKVGQVVLWVSTPAAALLVWSISRSDDRKLAEEMERWRKKSGKRKARVVVEDYDNPAVVRSAERATLTTKPKAMSAFRGAMSQAKGAEAKDVIAAPWELNAMLELAGGGKQAGVYQLLPKLAYVVAVEADGLASSDFVAVVAKLEAKYVQVLARPRTAEDVPKGPPIISKDAAFRHGFWVECAEPKAARELLSEGLRETLRDLGDAWLFVRGDAMALVRYGRVTAERVHALVAGADEIFAEIGADGGPSLVGEDDGPMVPAKLPSPARA